MKNSKAPENNAFRTLNYLGSKLRLLDFIDSQINTITSPNGGVCDLFAGSGCVSYKLSNSFPIIACDIQNYSTVICNALLKKFKISDKELAAIHITTENIQSNELTTSFQPLIDVEESAIHNHRNDILTDIIEHGSVEVFTLEQNKSLIEDSLSSVETNLKKYQISKKTSLISKYYGGVYFSYRQAVIIDILLQQINEHISPQNKDLFLAALLSTASDLASTVGKHFAQPLKARDSKGSIKPTVYSKALKDKTIDALSLFNDWLSMYLNLSKSPYCHTVFQGDYMDCLKVLPDNVETVYADPPYTRDHYSRFYHVLETMALRDTPTLSTVTAKGETHISNGIYRINRHQSPFCIKSQAPKAFEKMFEICSSKNKNLLVSYSPYDETKKTHPRVVTMSHLLELANKFFKNVNVVSAGHFSHNKLTSSSLFLEASDEAELLIVCTNK